MTFDPAVYETLVDVFPSTRPCWKCSKYTRYLDVDLEVSLCLQCYDGAWNEYFKTRVGDNL